MEYSMALSLRPKKETAFNGSSLDNGPAPGSICCEPQSQCGFYIIFIAAKGIRAATSVWHDVPPKLALKALQVQTLGQVDALTVPLSAVGSD